MGFIRDNLDSIREEAMDFAGIGLYRYRLDGTMVFADRNAIRIADLQRKYPDPAMIAGQNITTLFHSTSPPITVREAVRARGGGVHGFELLVRTLTGEERWILHDAYLVLDSETGEQVVQAVIQDITERKRIEKALRESEEKYRTLTEHSLQGLIIAQGVPPRLVFANPMAVEILGRNVDELLSLPPEEVPLMLHPDDRPVVLDRFAKRLEGEPLSDLHQCRMVRPDGTVRWVDLLARRIRYGGLPAVQAAIFDITEHKEAEEDLRRSEAMYRLLAENAKDVIWTIDTDFRYTYVSPSVTHLRGYTPEEVMSQGIEQVLTPESIERVGYALAGAFTAGPDDPRSVVTVEAELACKDGSAVQTEMSVSPLVDGEGRFLGLLGVTRDITERKRAEEERRRLEAQVQYTQKLESLGVLAGGIAHDFNNLLMGILGNVGLVLLRIPADSPLRAKLREIRSTAERAAELCRQMLAYAGRSLGQRQPLGLNQILQEMGQLLAVSISKKARLRFQLADRLPAIEGDATQIRQVVMNLITNASEALGETAGVITLSTGVMECDRSILSSTYLDDQLQAGDYVFLEVSDTGGGMDKETKTRIFEPFFTTKFSGRGLGLAAVIGIVRGHKGALQVESELGRGSRFRILFPRCGRVSGAEKGAPALPPQWTGSGTILVVDDEEVVRLAVQDMLQEFGFDVAVAARGDEALRLMREVGKKVRLVLLDVTMPDMDGEEALREIRRIRSDVPILITSGFSEEEVVRRFSGEEFAGFLQKPYRPVKLLEKLREVLGGRTSAL